MKSHNNSLDVNKLVDELLWKGNSFNLISDKALEEGIEACTKITGLSESDPLSKIPADRLYKLPQAAVVEGHESTLLSWSAGDVYLVFPGRLASEFADALNLQEDTEREVSRPVGLSGMLDVFVENRDGSLTQVEDDLIEGYLENGLIFDNLYYRYEELPDKVVVKYRVLIAYESSRFPGFTLLGTQHGGYLTESAIESLSKQEKERKRVQKLERDKIEAEINNPVDLDKLSAIRKGESSILSQRRQRFLPADYSNAMLRFLRKSVSFWRDGRAGVSSDPEDNRDIALKEYASSSYKLWLLRYTAGEPVDVLRKDFESVVAALEESAQFTAKLMGVTTTVPFEFTDIDDYERALQQISLCILLHREDLLMRMAALIDPAYKGEDTIVEDLMAFYQEGRIDVDEWFHKKPYTTLVSVMYNDDSKDAEEKLKRYCKEWYPSLKQAPWHDGHLRINGTDGDYFGYWAFEAAAVSYLYKIDDSKIDHMVYPRALVDFARNYK